MVFPAVVFPMEKEQKLPPKCPLTGEWTKQRSYSNIPVSTLSNLTNNAELKKKLQKLCKACSTKHGPYRYDQSVKRGNDNHRMRSGTSVRVKGMYSTCYALCPKFMNGNQNTGFEGEEE